MSASLAPSPIERRYSCCTCRGRKPRAEFFADVSRGAGISSRCRACGMGPKTSTQRRRRNASVEVYRAARAEVDPAFAAKLRARQALRVAVRKRIVAKPSACSECGARTPRPDLHGHHDDPARPLLVRWLCRTCHLLEHGQTPRRAA